MGNELDAMAAVDTALQDLEDDERRRVLNFAIDKYGEGAGISLGDRGRSGRDSRGDEDGPYAFQRIADLFDQAQPATGADHALVGGYWFQVIQGQDEFKSADVNAELKDLGHGIGNITDAFNTLMNRKPATVRQVEKSGSSKQARKKYRLTAAGIRAVEAMLGTSSSE